MIIHQRTVNIQVIDFSSVDCVQFFHILSVFVFLSLCFILPSTTKCMKLFNNLLSILIYTDNVLFCKLNIFL